jgi:hypothetical protein
MTWTNINTDANANWQNINTSANPSWGNLNTNANANWQNINTAANPSWSGFNMAGYARGSVSGACLCEVPVSGLTDVPPDWTVIETA